MKSWYYNENASGDQRCPHYPTPIDYVSQSELDQLGVLYWHLKNTAQYDNHPDSGELGRIRNERDYKNHDIVTISKNTLPNYNEKLEMFFQEHLHEDEEIRFCMSGSGYFDIKSDINQKWIRIHVTEGDLIVLPAGCYHRFTVDENDYIKAMRLFKELPKWEAINRTSSKAELTQARKDYLKFIELQMENMRIDNQPNHLNGGKTISTTSINGTSFIRSNAAQALANYPHMRKFGNLIYISGMSSRQSDGTHLGVIKQNDGTFQLSAYDQTIGVLQNIENSLKELNLDRFNLIDCTCFLIDMCYYEEFNRAYNEFFIDSKISPTRTTVAIKQLPHPNLIVEIKAIAADPTN